MKKYLRRLYTLDSRPLHAQWPFWYALIGPLLIAIYVFLHTFNGVESFWQVSGQEEILKDSKIALLIAALSPISTTIITNIHRTIQTNTQILATNAKNIVDAYITHQKVCIENLNHINDNFSIELLPLEDAIEIQNWPEENRRILTDSQISDRFVVFDFKYYHVKLNLIYSFFFPDNNLSAGVKSYESKNIIPSVRKLVDSFLYDLLCDHPYTMLLEQIDQWDYKATRSAPEQLSPELKELMRSLDSASFRVESDYFRERPQLAISEYVAKVNDLLMRYYTNVEISVDGKPVKKNIFDIFYSDLYKVEMRDISAYICESILHVLEVNIAMGGGGDIYPVLKRLKVLNILLSRLDDYLSNKLD